MIKWYIYIWKLAENQWYIHICTSTLFNIIAKQNQSFPLRRCFQEEEGSRWSPSLQRCSVCLSGSFSKHCVLFRSSADPPKFSLAHLVTLDTVRWREYIYIYLYIYVY